jgi:hypothetical protein
MSRKVISKFRCLCEIKLTDGTVRRIQNWQYDPLIYKTKSWNYAGFVTPPFNKKIGEDAQSIQLTLPNIGSSQHGYLPVRDWVQNGSFSNAYIIFYLFVDDISISKHVFIVAERSFDDSSVDQESIIKINLRQPDDRTALLLTQKFDHKRFGELPQYSI